jgi:inosose dehydratase
VPAGRARAAGTAAPPSDAAGTFWSNCDEVSGLGFHTIEINNTRPRIADLYSDRVAEFKQEMAARHLTMAGLALFSHMAESTERRDLIVQHMLIGRFLAAVGGKYITHMLAPGTVLNEPTDDAAYNNVDLKEWAGNACEIGKRLLNEFGIALAYHPEQGEVRTGLYERILAAADERYFRFLADTGHIASGGTDAAAVCRKYRSRLECVHLKDFSPKGGQSVKAGNATLGEGIVDFTAVIDVLRNTGFTGYVMSESGGTNQVMRDYMTAVLKLSI